MIKQVLYKYIPGFIIFIVLIIVTISIFNHNAYNQLHRSISKKKLNEISSLIVNIIKAEKEQEFIDQLDIFSHQSYSIKLFNSNFELLQSSETLPNEARETTTLLKHYLDKHKNIPNLKEGEFFFFDSKLLLIQSLEIENSLLYLTLMSPVLSQEKAALSIFYQQSALAIIFLISSITLAIFVIRKIGDPLSPIIGAAQEYSRGNFSYRLKMDPLGNYQPLIDSINEMAGQLYDRVTDLKIQRNQSKAVLTNLSEPVIITDEDYRIYDLNSAAQKMLFPIKIPEIIGQQLLSQFRNTRLQWMAEQALKQDEIVEGEITLSSNQLVHIQVRAQRLKIPQKYNKQEKSPAKYFAILVLNDITRLKKLEKIRNDFVANVSHEIKTPITSIKGYVETLLEGKTHDQEQVKSFLKVVLNQTNRLNLIIDDLLKLSRLDEANQNSIDFKNHNIDNVIKGAMELCHPRAEAKGIILKYQRSQINCFINAFLLEQAIINLLDNAIKYSLSQTQIEITTHEQDGFLYIKVMDQGIGIPYKDLSRVFERFYRVDKARSREQGGTGLGLAIVKHIAFLHKGSVKVESTMGKGSTFTIILSQILKQSS